MTQDRNPKDDDEDAAAAGRERPVKLVDQWLAEYGKTHAESDSVPHWLYIPVVVLSFVGLLWSAPVPQVFADSTPALNWGALFLMATIVYYLIVSISLSLGVLPFIVLTVALLTWLERLALPLGSISGATFLAAWLGYGAARWLRGLPPSFTRELQLMMIGPMWLLARLYRRLGIAY